MNNIRSNMALMIALLPSVTFFLQALLGSRNMSLPWDKNAL